MDVMAAQDSSVAEIESGRPAVGKEASQSSGEKASAGEEVSAGSAGISSAGYMGEDWVASLSEPASECWVISDMDSDWRPWSGSGTSERGMKGDGVAEASEVTGRPGGESVGRHR